MPVAQMSCVRRGSTAPAAPPNPWAGYVAKDYHALYCRRARSGRDIADEPDSAAAGRSARKLHCVKRAVATEAWNNAVIAVEMSWSVVTAKYKPGDAQLCRLEPILV
jgi:hypothetical protein